MYGHSQVCHPLKNDARGVLNSIRVAFTQLSGTSPGMSKSRYNNDRLEEIKNEPKK